jgi:hypothetical protein
MQSYPAEVRAADLIPRILGYLKNNLTYKDILNELYE